jgi:hypothetical protein
VHPVLLFDVRVVVINVGVAELQPAHPVVHKVLVVFVVQGRQQRHVQFVFVHDLLVLQALPEGLVPGLLLLLACIQVQQRPVLA